MLDQFNTELKIPLRETGNYEVGRYHMIQSNNIVGVTTDCIRDRIYNTRTGSDEIQCYFQECRYGTFIQL